MNSTNTGGAGGRHTADPAPKARSRKPRRKGRRIALYVSLVVVLLLIATPLVAFGVAYKNADVPRPSDMVTNQVSTILASDGTEIARVVPPEGNRTEVTIDQIPGHVRNAVLSAEDRDFYTNPGFSVSGFARAARDNVLGRDSAGGGSTITQQYVKNTLVGSERSVTRKMKELVISSKMAREWSKDEILAAYLNTIYFGRGAYGISAAATAYFGKPLADITVAEGAVLAAVIQSPSSLDPTTDPEALQARWNYVLDGMVTMSALASTERQSMVFPDALPTAPNADSGAAPGPEGLIRAQVLRELAESGVSEQDLNTEGLQITTTIDPTAQQAALEAVADTFDGEPENLRTAVVSIDPKSGAVRAYYGGDDGKGFDFAQAGLQTGSSFKVFGLVAALQQDIPLSQTYDSSPLSVYGVTINNVEGESCGKCTIAEALKRSLNTSFYRLTLSMDDGAQKIADAAHQAGIPETVPGWQYPTLTQEGGSPENGIVLGQYLTRPIDMASAYATLAASGMYHKPYFVQKVVTADGVVLLDRPASEGERRLDAAVADNVSQAMLPIAAYSRSHGLAGGRPSASKTGTAQLGDTGKNKDAWMVGYTPQLSTAVWVGTADAQAIENSWGGPVYGSGLPSDIWKKTMDGALEDAPVEKFPWPAPIGGQAGVPAYTGVGSGSSPASSSAAAPAAPAAPPAAPAPQLPPPPAPRVIEILPGVKITLPG
ncbi:transglycosylase domain-containing protein [Prescottella equi]|uniref:transglycosylase domain-containing protein n=1 Tax=Rhodococcus hoagii TaxID=43767 RepID=UPI000A118F3B|nr:transglycosylase domain-containing protein [Prescottella equi]MBM4669431.1 penicillin-binding protein [Prescottella equi]NKS36292.1 penicillin-binding protein [Prescottella equi]NKV88417.1 penicillin-binding protein [Prescottella equi]ORL12418.1 penicillin-binding protein [Prescottella equi]ORL31491.1 penicillin-binding protein [Prescottella equi]